MASKAKQQKEQKPVRSPKTLFQLFLLILQSVFSKKGIIRIIVALIIVLAVSTLHTYLMVKIYGSIRPYQDNVI